MKEGLALLGQCTRKEIREGIKNGAYTIAMIPTGSTEQHNEHLPFLRDTLSAEHISKQVALRSFPRILVTPAIPIGNSDTEASNWMDHKGTLALRPEIFVDVVYDVCGSLVHHGIKNIVNVNGHYGNHTPLEERIEEFRKNLDADVRCICYGSAFTDDVIRRYSESGKHVSHAAEIETSIALAAFPHLVHMDALKGDYVECGVNRDNPDMAAWDMDAYHEAKLASREKGKALIDISVEWITREVVDGGSSQANNDASTSTPSSSHP